MYTWDESDVGYFLDHHEFAHITVKDSKTTEVMTTPKHEFFIHVSIILLLHYHIAGLRMVA